VSADPKGHLGSKQLSSPLWDSKLIEQGDLDKFLSRYNLGQVMQSLEIKLTCHNFQHIKTQDVCLSLARNGAGFMLTDTEPKILTADINMKQMAQSTRTRPALPSMTFLLTGIPKVLGASFRNNLSRFYVILNYDSPRRTDKQLNKLPKLRVFS
jgi:hypothetical protein